MAEYTQGPWRCWSFDQSRSSEFSHGVSAEGEMPCDVAYVVAFDGQSEESEANACRIVACLNLLIDLPDTSVLESIAAEPDPYNRLSRLAVLAACKAVDIKAEMGREAETVEQMKPKGD